MCKVGRALRADSLANFSGILAWAETSVRSLSRNFAAIARRISAEFNREDKLRLHSHESSYVWINSGFWETAHLPLP